MSNPESILAALGIGQSPNGPSLQVQLATLFLAVHNFQPPPPEGQAAVSEAIEALSKIDPKDIDSLMIVGVIKNEPGKPCQDCGEIHADGVHMFLMSSGNPETLLAARVVAEDKFNRDHTVVRTGGDTTQRH